jgi:hypothetical protein
MADKVKTIKLKEKNQMEILELQSTISEMINSLELKRLDTKVNTL